MKDAVIILCGGGPAPGMNSVSMSVAKTFLSKGYRVIGLHGGYSGLFSKNARTEDLTSSSMLVMGELSSRLALSSCASALIIWGSS